MTDSIYEGEPIAYENGNIEMIQYTYSDGTIWWVRCGAAGIYVNGKDMVSLMELVQALMEDNHEI